MPRTSASSRPKRTFECKIDTVGQTKSIVVRKKEAPSDIRAIHSSQKSKGFRKMLNIETNRKSSRL